MKYLFVLFLVSNTLISLAQVRDEEEINKEWFYLGAGISHPIEDQTQGLNLKFGLPMQKGFYFNTQATYFPSILNYKYTEFRYEFNVELTLFSIKGFSTFANAGLNYGMFRREYATVNMPIYDGFLRDQSLLFGGGFEYKVKRIKYFVEWKKYHQIGRNQINAGLKFQFFENKDLKEAYLKYQSRKKKTPNQ